MLNACASSYSVPDRPTTTGSAATANSDPARATALLTPLASPARSGKPIEHLELNLEYLLPYDISARVGYELAPGLTAYGLLP